MIEWAGGCWLSRQVGEWVGDDDVYWLYHDNWDGSDGNDVVIPVKSTSSQMGGWVGRWVGRAVGRWAGRVARPESRLVKLPP